MENYLQKNSEFCIIPEDFDNAVIIKSFSLDSNILILNADQDIKFHEGEQIELFTNVKNGILYCKTFVACVKNNILQIAIPSEYEILQRRENERYTINENITIFDNEIQINATLIDLSTGGMKIRSDKKFEINNTYITDFNFENLNLQFEFTPLRISAYEDKYEISGTINSKNPSDKIELVQYCYKKQFEESSRQ